MGVATNLIPGGRPGRPKPVPSEPVGSPLRPAHVGALLLTCAGLVMAINFHLRGPLPQNLAIGGLLALGIVAIVAFMRDTPLLAPGFFLIAYTLPFFSLVGHLFSDDYYWWWTPQATAMISRSDVTAGMATIGLVGLAGLIAGMLASDPREHGRSGPGYRQPEMAATLGFPSFGVWLLICLLLSAASARSETILQSAVGVATPLSWATRIHFPAAFLVSYLGMFTLFLDAEREPVEQRRRMKLGLLYGVAAYIVVFLQLLRGDREAVGLIAGLAALYITRPAWNAVVPSRGLVKRRLRRALPAAVAMVLVLIALGYARYVFFDAFVRPDIRTLLRFGLAHATWSAVLLTNLQTAWDYTSGALSFQWGRTYLDYLLSLPPGVVTHAFGLERPLEPWRGGAWDVAGEVGAGGIHVVLTPFRNFGALGAFGVLFLIGAAIGHLERGSASHSAFRRLLWASVIGAGLHWFWYGDMNAVRAVMGAAIAYFLYRLTLGLSLGIRRPRALQLK